MASSGTPEHIQRKLAALPAEPGVYVFTDAASRVVYVGKAASLRSRVRSYFSGASDGRPLFRSIVENTADLDCIICENELEALLLENNLIKKHRPRFNVRLRDDKTYVSLRVTHSEEWPRVQVVRQWKDDGNSYFGPYSSAQSVREMLRVIKKFFPLRTCANGFFRNRKRPCMEYEIGQCTAPCVGLISREDYQRWVDETVLFLRGKNQTLLPVLEERMRSLAEKREYERAAKVRDQIAAIRRVMERQKVQEIRFGDLDIFGWYRKEDFVSIHVLLNRDGKLIHSSTHSYRTPLPDGEVLSSFLTQFYAPERYLPPEILVPFEFEDAPLIEEWLARRRGKRLTLHVPKRGGKRKLVDMASKNGAINSENDELRQRAQESLAERLAVSLGLVQPLHRIECYDIAHLQGSLTVASRVVFEAGEPVPALYRRYKIRTVDGNDDFASLMEVLARRFRGQQRRDVLPDVVMVDGGKGQVNSVQQVLTQLGVAVPLIGIAKDRRRKGAHTTERIYLPYQSEPLDVSEESPESRFLQRVRDEAHRFANEFHRELRRKRALSTGLEEIPGIGARRRQSLLAHFGSLKALRTATVEEIAAVPGMTESTAQSVRDFLNGE